MILLHIERTKYGSELRISAENARKSIIWVMPFVYCHRAAMGWEGTKLRQNYNMMNFL